jgi:micrococcal nuclease
MRIDTTNTWFSRQPWGVKALVVVLVLIVLFLGATGCSPLGIPTAETARVDGVAASAAPTSATATTPVAGAPAVAAPAEPTAEEPSGLTPGAMIAASVVRVVDGDTAVFRLSNGTQEKVRFIGVNTPESTTKIEPYGKEASKYTTQKLWVGRKVFLEKDVEARDRYGRLLAYIWLDKPTAITSGEVRVKMFNAKLANDGYAQQMTIPPNVKYAEYFRTFCGEARSAGRGLWADQPAEALTAAGAAAAAGAAGAAGSAPGAGTSVSGSLANAAYVGNSNTRKFHKPSCSSVAQMSADHRVALSSRAQAISQGYVPCGNCRP